MRPATSYCTPLRPVLSALALLLVSGDGASFTFSFGTVWVLETGPELRGQVWNSSSVKPEDYAVEAPAKPFVLRSGSLSGTLQPLEAADIVFGIEAPYTTTVSKRYDQYLKVSRRIDWRLTAVVKGPGLSPEAHFELPETSCVNVPITMDASASLDPDDEGAVNNGIARWIWTLWDPYGKSVQVWVCPIQDRAGAILAPAAPGERLV